MQDQEQQNISHTIKNDRIIKKEEKASNGESRVFLMNIILKIKK